MSCSKSFTLSQAVTGENPMDSAAYASTDNLIIGVRGSRVYKCSAADGSIITSMDFQQFAYGPSSIVYDVGIGRCFAACGNTPSFDTANALGIRQITRIIPSNVTPDLLLDLTTTFGLGTNLSPFMMDGIVSMKSLGGQIYGMGYLGIYPTTIFKFQANNPVGSNEFHFAGGEYSSFALAVVGGNQRMYFNSIPGQNVEWWDFVTVSGGGGGVDTNNRLSIEYAPTQGRFYVPEEFQFIDLYDNTGTFISQLNTARSNFNGVNIQRNPYTDLLYVFGGTDNSVVVINPATNAFTVKLGFDNPVNGVFTPTKSFAVQAGAVGLKEVI